MKLMGADDYFNAVDERMVKEQLSSQSHGTN
jgi:hypothetical protein